jgi:hypothetical protein
MDYISDDGKIKVSYTHMEMPQTDENRTYYTMKYEVLEDISFENFREDFTFYTVAPKDNMKYQKLGYLTNKNQHSVKPVNPKNSPRSYVLGNECPYFSLFQATDDSSSKNDYVNLSFLILNSDFVIGGDKVEPAFIIHDFNNTVKLSLDLGATSLKAGDTFTINAIILPWGSQKTVYEGDIIDPEFKPNQNVIDVRENSLLDPFKATAVKNCVISKESAFLPVVQSTNGRDAEFTLSGGANNCTVKLEGFTDLTIPTVYELNEEGQWERYNLSSHFYPDNSGFANDYDGYGVKYEEDGLFSYSFVVKMTPGKDRTFRFVVDEEEYRNNPEVEPENGGEDIIPPAELVEGYNRYFDADTIKIATGEGNSKMGKVEVLSDSTGKFVRMYGLES